MFSARFSARNLFAAFRAAQRRAHAKRLRGRSSLVRARAPPSLLPASPSPPPSPSRGSSCEAEGRGSAALGAAAMAQVDAALLDGTSEGIFTPPVVNPLATAAVAAAGKEGGGSEEGAVDGVSVAAGGDLPAGDEAMPGGVRIPLVLTMVACTMAVALW
jgi:hypothetical protein